MTAPTLRQRLRYTFDNAMAKGPGALIGLLGLASLLLVVVFSAIVLIGGFAPKTDGHKVGVIRQLFNSLLHSIDGGTVAGDTGKWYFLLTMLVLTFGGIFIVSIFIGVLTTGLEGRIDELRKGRSQVLENGHTLVLNWNDQVFTILSELLVANESEKRSAVVILADRDRVEMEDAIRERVGDTGSMRIVCRSGSPIDISDLSIVNPGTAKSIIVLSPGGDEPDSEVIKTVLAVTTASNGDGPPPAHVVAEIHNARNLEAARLVGGDQAMYVDVADTISRLVVQTSRQPGLPVVYQELLDFDGHEIYFHRDPGLAGRTFGEVLGAYEHAAVLGLHHGGGRIALGPSDETVVGEGDELIVIAEDDSVLAAAAPATGAVHEPSIVAAADPPDPPERLIVLGWNDRGPAIVEKLDGYVAKGSEVHVVADVERAGAAVEEVADRVINQSVSFTPGDTTDRATLDSLELHTYEHVIVLCYEDDLDVQRADARTLVTLLHLRDIESKQGERFSVVSEMLDDRNRQLAEVTAVDDFIVSERLLSLLLSQVSENRHLMAVFSDLFDTDGHELYLKPAGRYVDGGAVSFATVVEAARRRGEVALGWRLGAKARDAEHGYGVVVNPPKSATLSAVAGDCIIVLSDD